MIIYSVGAKLPKNELEITSLPLDRKRNDLQFVKRARRIFRKVAGKLFSRKGRRGYAEDAEKIPKMICGDLRENLRLFAGNLLREFVAIKKEEVEEVEEVTPPPPYLSALSFPEQPFLYFPRLLETTDNTR